MLTFRHQSHVARLADSAAPLIGLGLANLILAAWLPVLPILTGVAVLALGATNATLARYRGLPTAAAVLCLHSVTYVGLYALFIGGVLHAAASQPNSGLVVITMLDIAASTVPMAVALKRITACLREQVDSPG